MRRVFLAAAACLMAACIEGPPGPEGPQGPQGEQGPAGNAGGGYTVLASTLCQRVQDGMNLRYQAVEYSNGDVWTTCTIADAFDSTSESYYYSAQQQGAANHQCLLTYDADGPAASGWWFFHLGSVGYEAVYNDTSSELDGFVVVFSGASATDGGCTTFTPGA